MSGAKLADIAVAIGHLCSSRVLSGRSTPVACDHSILDLASWGQILGLNDYCCRIAATLLSAS